MNELIVECQSRRQKLAASILPNSMIIIPGAKIKYRNADVDYCFRQESNFYYLTGFTEPEALLVITKDKDGRVISILFNLSKNWADEIWSGARVGQEAAKNEYKFDKAYPDSQIDSELPQLMSGKEVIYYPIGQEMYLDRRISNWVKQINKRYSKSSGGPRQLQDVIPLLAEMRLIKSTYEIGAMRNAAQISAMAHTKVMQICMPGKFEFQLAAEFNYQCSLAGCNALAYNSIVGSGENACTLHYVSNNAVLQNQQLVLIDAGGEYNYYASDITRTFPVNGKFTQEQKQIYNLVLQAQKSTIDKIRPGVCWDALQVHILQVMVTGLIDLGLLIGNVADLIENKAYKKFYMHNSGHWLGLDVHDLGSYYNTSGSRILQPGMVLTIEPGIYISSYLKDVHAKWHSIGVRIEDDILVTENGYEVLSKDVPKEIADIEELMRI